MPQDMARPLILIGGGGHCRSVIDAAESAGMTIAGILDAPSLKGTSCLGYPVVGTDDDIPLLAADHDFIVTLGSVADPSRRIALHKIVEAAGGSLAKVIASTARVSSHASLGDGTVVLHQATVNAGARVGSGCIINTASNIEHDVTVGDYCHVSTGAMVNGGCSMGARCFIGSGAVIIHGVSIAPGTVIGAGATVCSDIDIPGVYVGVPARIIMNSDE